MLKSIVHLWNSSVIAPFVHSAALLQAVLQVITEAILNGQVETSMRAEEWGTY